MSLTIRGADAVEADFEALANAFDLTADRLGERLCDDAANGIMMNMVLEQDPDGNRWPELSPAYAAEKDLITPGAPMAVLYGIMRTSEEICGVREVTPGVAEMGYGVSFLARIEAQKFQEGGALTGTTQPPRPFYAFNAAGIELATTTLDEHFLALEV